MVYLELKKGRILNDVEKNALELKCQEKIIKKLVLDNLDYAGAYEMEPKLNRPIVKLIRYQHYPFDYDTGKPKPLFIKKN